MGFVAFSLLSSILYSQGTSVYQDAFAKPNKPDLKDTLTVNVDKHHYELGENVTIAGSITTNLWSELDDNTNLVSLQVKDNKDVIVASEEAEISNVGEYSKTFKLSQDARHGAYIVDATVRLATDPSYNPTDSGTETLHKFVKFTSSEYPVRLDGNEFTMYIISNSTVTDFFYSKEENMISFKVEGETGTRGVTRVTLPKELLGEDIIVSIDGRDIAKDSPDVIVTSDSRNEIAVEINYLHSEHSIRMRGKYSAPQPPDSVLLSPDAALEPIGLPAVTSAASIVLVVIIAAVAIFLSIYFRVHQNQMEKGGQGTWRRLGFPSSTRGGDKVIDFYCMSCGAGYDKRMPKLRLKDKETAILDHHASF